MIKFQTMKKQKILKSIFGGILSLAIFSCAPKEHQESIPKLTIVEVNSTQELIDILKNHNLWNLKGLPSIIIKKLPSDFKYIRNEQLKRKIFIHSLLPSAIVAFAEIEEERKQLKEILAKIDYPKYIDLDILNNKLNSQDIAAIHFLINKYRTNNSKELLKRINTVPLSLLIAQAAMESNWGTSRFALEGNNLFGIWTYKRNGIIPIHREPDAQHKVAKYTSILEATRDYLYNLNVGWAYAEFREARLYTMNPIKLAKYLFRYSQIGSFYVNKLQDLINKYHLKDYDIYQTCLAQLNFHLLAYHSFLNKDLSK
ncbi:MAG TPA: hypothetical protein ENG63_05395 [Candidatus Desulfofervidus auxilii]|uniref:Mannosyl-glycoprotein endo-beta-N-acetylglucosamidase-like domain-containing protein n=1 Tax=Desulfofervidus auxilii TaxID=1621989 RepID=A0A7C0Y4K0_DESA2|nr:hypothetical protein [Candidatus Desulfofervidus auxilii]